MDTNQPRQRRHLNIGFAVSVAWCLAVWFAVLHLLGLGL